MIRSVVIKGFRVFRNFEMAALGRVNLLVGVNNSGKTSLLEALYLLANCGDLNVLWRIMGRRGEYLVPDQDSASRAGPELDVTRLFWGHELKIGSSFSIDARNEGEARSLQVRLAEAAAEKDPSLFSAPGRVDDELAGTRLALELNGNPAPPIPIVPLSRRGGLRFEIVADRNRPQLPRSQEGASQFITTESLALGELTRAWNAIVLTKEEERVVRALRFLEPGIERLAAVATGMDFYFPPGRGGFVVKLKGVDQPVPIGSLGDGTWRMLALAIALSRAQGQLLLVDEIDTGLHYTIMADMWKLVFEAAKELNVQVFATTHSDDCVRSLATICKEDVRVNSQVTIQRIEPSRQRAVPYAEAEIKVAAERNIEVR